MIAWPILCLEPARGDCAGNIGLPRGFYPTPARLHPKKDSVKAAEVRRLEQAVPGPVALWELRN